MINFAGFEVVPAEGMLSKGWSNIRITVSAKKVGLSSSLIDGLGHPSFISLHRGVGENEGKLIIVAAENAETPGGIRIDSDRKKIEFFNSGFVSMCLDMLRKYAGASLKRGIYFSIAGMRLDAPEVQAENDEGERTPAFVFDFREASEHYVKASPRNSFQSGHAPGPQAGGSTVVQHPSGFNMPRNYTARM